MSNSNQLASIDGIQQGKIYEIAEFNCEWINSPDSENAAKTAVKTKQTLIPVVQVNT